MKTLTLSIVVYKNYGEVVEAIESLEKYTSGSIDKTVYIIDNTDCSTDEEFAKREEFKKQLKRFEDVQFRTNNTNQGFGKGHNMILDEIDSKYHAIVNPDILFKEDAFKEIITFMDENQKVGMVIPRLEDEKGNLQAVYRTELTIFDMFIRMFMKNKFKKRQAKHTMQDMDYTKVFDVPFGQGSFLVIRTDLYRELEGFDDRFFMYLEDADLCKRVNKVSKLVYYPGATVIHKWEKGSHKNKKLFKIHVQSMFKYFFKWGFKLF
ncbi:glycosyltransferase family 2 protein [Lachnobacterium bovis]|jgi:hypothetical protein|uniref:Glycosyltransferase 2-like domain-containing protein n=1 Tax=Lachnobacterium bovis DSM 14045 TaxID=1122142 RepID=A0A1H3HYH9_9FIRM|nr:glycosyltransferase family 2 protein [Lachnobacterium bovis]SDY19829.1 hypothetical protein SAMN02910414_00981 [Lachnobacterium bovis DSM 14045]